MEDKKQEKTNYMHEPLDASRRLEQMREVEAREKGMKIAEQAAADARKSAFGDGATYERKREPTITPDQEVWVKDRLWSLLRMFKILDVNAKVGADRDYMMNGAVDGLIHGTAVELIYTLGHEPPFVNLRGKPRSFC